MNIFRSLGLAKAPQRPARQRLTLDISHIAVYAIGDVHGCYDQLLALERIIAADASRLPDPKLIVMLGDYIDRGPAPAEVIEHLIGPPPDGFYRICLMGNHEMAMLDYLDGQLSLKDWLKLGAAATLFSYGIDVDQLKKTHRTAKKLNEAIQSAIPESHVEFLRSLPIMIDSGFFVFAHAGIRPGTLPAEQTDEDLVTIREDFFASAHLLDRWVVHGHTPVEAAGPVGRRINVDTGAFFSDKLSAVRLWNRKGRILST
ncbi:serine/threonine protein phosphatase [Brucella endophytica]|uniref:Serine/threonine protein phosphatase n=1 Tax=Brucella endophytica TaxID=1963359 RepID=A0A916WIY1_9HYPH|nr:metallophosphoesterase [Brucella endophytica]GGB02435.1 serine/threonine protein phosphatase [Brucella endophytica]